VEDDAPHAHLIATVAPRAGATTARSTSGPTMEWEDEEAWLCHRVMRLRTFCASHGVGAWITGNRGAVRRSILRRQGDRAAQRIEVIHDALAAETETGEPVATRIGWQSVAQTTSKRLTLPPIKSKRIPYR
jgi:hypothetical protein